MDELDGQAEWDAEDVDIDLEGEDEVDSDPEDIDEVIDPDAEPVDAFDMWLDK